MRVLVTGNLGYIGSVLSPRLQNMGYEVHGVDAGFFDDCIVGPKPEDPPTLKKDIRDVTPEDLHGYDAVIHLAGLSNDPLGELEPKLTEEINFEATMRLAEFAKSAGVQRFIYASSQSMYGISDSDNELDEDNSRKNPVTEYAKTKWRAEQELKSLATSDFLTVSFRPSTVYGSSPRQRSDIVFNNLVGAGFTTGKITVKSDGSPWRPVVHVQDVCAAFESGLRASGEILNKRAFNVGPIGGNFRISDLASAAKEANPGSILEYTGEHGSDSRTYRVSFERINRELSEYFTPTWTLSSGADELVKNWTTVGFDVYQFNGPKTVRLEKLQQLLKNGEISEDLRYV
jgi:nucleoside-diphosphate-sugar epimerase